MTREEQINKSCNDLLKGAGIDELERLKLGMWYKLGAKFADENPKEVNNWQQVRIQAAIAAMQGMLQNDCSKQIAMNISEKVHRLPSDILATMAVSQADALVKELKGE